MLYRVEVNDTKRRTCGVHDAKFWTIKSFDKLYMAFSRFNYPIRLWEHYTADSYMILSLD